MKSRNPSARGFTLLELLVVMTIIAVLAGGIFSAAQYAIRKARGIQAQNMAVGLANGINNFKTDYGRFPYPGGTKTETFQSNSTFMVNLIGRDTTINKRGRNFVDSLPVAKGSPPVGGLFYSSGSTTADLFDPWGNLFEIAVDHDGDGQVTNPEGGADKLNLKVAIISKGNDKKLTGTNDDGQDAAKDNVRSW